MTKIDSTNFIGYRCPSCGLLYLKEAVGEYRCVLRSMSIGGTFAHDFVLDEIEET